MAEKRYSIPENLRGSVFHTKKLGKIEIGDETTQKQLKHLREDIGVQDIQVGQDAMTLGEEIKVMRKDLESMEAQYAKEQSKVKTAK